ncbi:hypothetical protein FRC10_003145 [Ceratobasidium sp. 414]|nr:hypothetical protein FRC10_003145 [Ceratobasidium sp. 414]
MTPVQDWGRVRTLAGAVLVALASGTNYGKLGLFRVRTAVGKKAKLVAYATECDWDSGEQPLFIATAFLLFGYGGIRLLFTHATPLPSGPHSTWPFTALVTVLSICSWLTGVAGSGGIISVMNAAVRSFPERLHASVTGTVNSAFGLSAFFFSFLAHEFFPGRTTSFLTVLVWGTSIPVLIGSLIIKTAPLSSANDEGRIRLPGDDNPQARTGGEDTSVVEDEIRDVLRNGLREPYQDEEETPLRTGEDSVLYGDRNPWASQAQTPANATPKSGVSGGEEDVHGLALFGVVDFWIIFGIVGCYINNVGSIVQALFAVNGGGEWDEGTVQAAQAYQVGVLSVSSFVGRLSVGFLADYINHWHTLPRTSCLIVSSIAGIIAQCMLTRVESTAGLSRRELKQTLGQALFGNVFNYGFGRNFDAHSGGPPPGTASDAGNMQCYSGRLCYVDA